jgi:glutathione S-transferase
VVARTGVWMIPVVITPEDETLQDSTHIIDVLEQRFTDAPVLPSTPCQALAAQVLELFGDEWMIMTAICYRWTKPENTAFAIQQFGEQARPDGTAEEQHEAGMVKARAFGGWVGLFGIDDVTGPAIEAAYEELLGALEVHFQTHGFLLGSRPSIADFSLFGGLYAVLFRDPLSGRLMRERAPAVVDWVGRLLEPRARAGEFLPNDEVPATLDMVFRAIFNDQFPVLRDTIAQVAQWVRNQPGEVLPKTIGKHGFTLRGRPGVRCVYPYAQWMLQRILDRYAAIPAEDRQTVDAWLGRVGGEAWMSLEVGERLSLVDYKLIPTRSVDAQPPVPAA